MNVTLNRQFSHFLRAMIALVITSCTGCIVGSSLKPSDIGYGRTVYLDSPDILHNQQLTISDGTVLTDGEEGQIIDSGTEYYAGGYPGNYPYVLVRFRRNITIHFMQSNFGTAFKDYRIRPGTDAVIAGKHWSFSNNDYSMWKIRNSR